MKKIWITWIAFLIVSIAIVSFVLYIYDIIEQKEYISTQSIVIKEIVFEDDEWIVKGLLDMNEEKTFIFKKGFNGFDSREENGSFYLSLRYGVVSGDPAENFEIYLGKELDNVNEVFLQGNSPDDVKLVLKK